MFDECYEFVGDLAETIALLLPRNTLSESTLPGSTETNTDTGLAQIVAEFFQGVSFEQNDELRQRIIGVWRRLSDQERLVFNKLLTGGFRVGASQKLVVRGLSLAYQIDADVVTQRLMGAWERETSLIDYLTNPDVADTLRSRPYPFCLAHSLTEEAKQQLGPVDDWLIERKWDGIRAQIIRRGSETTIWSRGEEIVTQQFPELKTVGDRLPDGTVVDGEILVFRQGGPAGFAAYNVDWAEKILVRSCSGSTPFGLRHLTFWSALGQIFAAGLWENGGRIWKRSFGFQQQTSFRVRRKFNGPCDSEACLKITIPLMIQRRLYWGTLCIQRPRCSYLNSSFRCIGRTVRSCVENCTALALKG